MRRTLLAFAIGVFAIPRPIGAQIVAPGALAAPVISPYFSADGRAAFALDLVNTTGHDLMVGTNCRVRLDGVEEPRVATWTGLAGPTVPAGSSWRELIVLGSDKGHYSFAAPGFTSQDFAARHDSTMPVKPGRHMIAASCGTEWSRAVPFELATGDVSR